MPDPLSCPEMVELVSDYLEGVLPPEASSSFELHLTLCAGCVTYLDQLRETVAATGRLREDQVDPDRMAALLAAFRDWRDGT